MGTKNIGLRLVDTKQDNFYPYIYFDGHFMMLPILMGPIAPRSPYEPSGIGPGSCCCLR